MSGLNIDKEMIEEAWLVCFGDREGWHPSMGDGLFFSYKEAEAFVRHVRTENEGTEWCILRVLPFEIAVVNDITDPESPPKDVRR